MEHNIIVRYSIENINEIINKNLEIINHLNIPIGNIKFAGFTNEKYNPISLWFNKDTNEFNFSISKFYANNSANKMQKIILRYMVTTKPSGEFRSKKELYNIFQIINQYNNTYNLYNTYRSKFLLPDCSIDTSNGVCCDACGRTYILDKNSDIIKDSSHYRCQCGNTLTTIKNNKRTFFFNTRNRYLECNPRKLDEIRNIDKEILNTFTQADIDEFNHILTEYKSFSTKNINKILEICTDQHKDNIIEIIKALAPEAYNIFVNSYRPHSNKVITIKNGIPNYLGLSNDKLKELFYPKPTEIKSIYANFTNEQLKEIFFEQTNSYNENIKNAINKIKDILNEFSKNEQTIIKEAIFK